MVFTRLVDTVLAALNRTWWNQGKGFGVRLHYPSVSYADDFVVLALRIGFRGPCLEV